MSVLLFLCISRKDPNVFFDIIHEDKASVEHGCMPQQIQPLQSFPPAKVSPVNKLNASHLSLTKAKNQVHDNEEPESKRLYVISLFFKNCVDIYAIANLYCQIDTKQEERQ